LSDPTYEFVIIGAGTAGCLLANRLSAAPACRVLLIEAGGNDNYHWIHIPVGYLRCIGNPRTDWCYRASMSRGSTATCYIRAARCWEAARASMA
jgi:choline dehydrogenase